MAKEGVQRRLTAILAADVVGYSRLVRADEEDTLARLKALRADLVDPALSGHGGRIVKTMGDGLLVEFASVVEAVQGATELQQAMAKRNRSLPGDRRIVFRIGINLGDVIIDGDDIHGDGVNIAARLEALADPGAVCVSGAVYDQVRDRLDLAFEDMGEKEIKNIDRPVQVWRWTTHGAGAAPLPTTAPEPDTAPNPLPLPEGASIAVLPFDNMSGDPEQEFFADGIADDIITALSRMHGAFVIARNSSFSYRGQAVDIRRVGRELGVRYVLEGSVRRGGNQVRVTAQLIEAKTGSQVWADRYDRPLDDIFAIQDEITESVAGAVDSRIRATEMKRAAQKRPEDLGSWERIMKAWSLLHKTTEADNEAAREICLQVVATDRGNHRALSALAYGHAMDSLYGWGPLSPADAGQEAARAAQAAIASEPNDEWGHGVFSMILWLSGQHEAAIREGEAAIEINPNYNVGHHILGAAHGYSGAEHYEHATRHLALAIRLDPRDIWVAWPHANLGMTELIAGNYDAAIAHARTALDRNPLVGVAHHILASALALNGDVDAGHAAWTQGLSVHPFDFAVYLETARRVFKKPSDMDRWVHGMRLVGAPLED